jgi:cell division septation protein DedD
VLQQNAPDPVTNSPVTPAADIRTDTSAQSAQTNADASEAAPSADAALNSDVASAATSKAEEVDADPVSATYYDVGNFKDLARADKATDDLGKLGFRAIVVHKMLLWMGSFHVVVGPFTNDQDSEAARSRLENLGFSPRIAKTH